MRTVVPATRCGKSKALGWVALLSLACGARATPTDPTPATEPVAASPCRDGDGDRVVDHCDQCPDQSETWQGIADWDGCPDTSALGHQFRDHPLNRFAAPLAWVPMEAGSSEVPESARRALQLEAARLVSQAEPFAIVCVGQSAEAGPTAMASSRGRAEAVCAVLRAAGVPAERLTVLGAGAARMRRVDHPDVQISDQAIAQVVRFGEHVVHRVGERILEAGDPAPEPVMPPRSPGCDDQGNLAECAERP